MKNCKREIGKGRDGEYMYKQWERGKKKGTMLYYVEIHTGSHTILNTIGS